MYCTTCGAVVPAGQNRCGFCGTRAPGGHAGAGAAAGMAGANGGMQQSAGFHPTVPQMAYAMGEPVGLCPRCAFHGAGSGYFSRGGNVAKLVVLTLITGGAFGVGGILYYLARKDSRVCPRCGEKWGSHGEKAAMLAAASRGGVQTTEDPRAMAAWSDDVPFGFGSLAMFVLASIFLVGGVAGMELAPILFGLLSLGGALGLHHRKKRQSERRREMMLAGLQTPVLKLAATRGGRLTVTEVASEMGWALPRAEKVLMSLDDGYRVRSDVTREGLLVYEFPELMGSGAPRLPEASA